MKKSVKCAVTAALLLLLCAVGIYGIFFAPRKIGCAVDDSFSWKAYSYTPVTSKTIYNYAFPSEEITLSAENRETIVQLDRMIIYIDIALLQATIFLQQLTMF